MRPGRVCPAPGWRAEPPRTRPCSICARVRLRMSGDNLLEAAGDASELSRSVSNLRLTIDEIIALDTDKCRQAYLSPSEASTPVGSPTGVADDASSVSSSFVADWANAAEAAASSASSTSSTGTLLSAYQQRDAFRGIPEDDFARLDRYGFLEVQATPSGRIQGARVACTNEALLRQKKAELDARAQKEASRALKWLDMLRVLEGQGANRWPALHRKFLPRLGKGVPDCLRGRVWQQLLAMQGVYDASSAGADEEPAAGALDVMAVAARFPSLYLHVSGFERQIDLDIERTLRDHVLFKIRYSQAQISLFKVLVAYSNYDAEVGYCQGMSTVAAFLLMYFDEAAAFGALVQLLRRDQMRLLYRAGFPLLFELFYVQERLMRKFVPELAAHLQRHAILTSIYATKWYLTLFLSFPMELAARIWDLLLFYGVDILPLTAVSLLKLHARKICAMPFEHTMQYLNRLADVPQCSHPDQLIGMVMQLAGRYLRLTDGVLGRGSCAGLAKYRAEFHAAQSSSNKP